MAWGCPSDMAFENAVAAAFRVYARCQDQQLAMAAMGGLPLYLDVAEARPAHATARALLPDARAAGLQAALAQVAAARPPPGWAVAVLAGRPSRASRGGTETTWAPRGRRRRRPSTRPPSWTPRLATRSRRWFKSSFVAYHSRVYARRRFVDTSLRVAFG